MSLVLRSYQIIARDNVLSAFESGARSVCLTMPCGAGKTPTFVDIAKRCHDEQTRTCIIAHRDSIILQISRKLTEVGIFHGIIAPGLPRTRDLVQVASIQTLIRRENKFDFIIIDECHMAVAPSYLKVIDANPDAFILGTTATPLRLDGSGLNRVFEKLVIGPSVEELINQNYLVRPIVYGPAHQLDLSSVKTRMGDFNSEQLSVVMDKPTITGSAVTEYFKLCDNQPALAFGCSIQHSVDIAAEFNSAGIKADFVSGKMSINHIRNRIADLADGRIQVLASCDLLSIGLDIPIVSVVIMLRPTASLTCFLQQAGRALRPHPGKEKAWILDHSGNYLRHGLPDDDREWSLEGRKKKPGAAPVRQCEKCFAAFRPAPVCPQCGYVFSIADRAREVEHVDGELQEIDPAKVRRARQEEEHAAKTYADLKSIAKRRGYKPQWAWYAATRRGIPI